MSGEKLVQLQNGGVIAFEEYGNPGGVPVVFCHGWPSSRIMAQLTNDAAHDQMLQARKEELEQEGGIA